MVEVDYRGTSLGRKQRVTLIGHLQNEVVLIAPLPRSIGAHFVMRAQNDDVLALTGSGFVAFADASDGLEHRAEIRDKGVEHGFPFRTSGISHDAPLRVNPKKRLDFDNRWLDFRRRGPAEKSRWGTVYLDACYL
jgi:hypothetical protein